MQPSKPAQYLAVLLALFSFPISHYNESVTDAGRPIMHQTIYTFLFSH